MKHISKNIIMHKPIRVTLKIFRCIGTSQQYDHCAPVNFNLVYFAPRLLSLTEVSTGKVKGNKEYEGQTYNIYIDTKFLKVELLLVKEDTRLWVHSIMGQSGSGSTVQDNGASKEQINPL